MDDSMNSQQDDILNQENKKPTRFLCPQCGQDSLIEGACPICGKPMLPDHEELPGEKQIEKDEKDNELENKSEVDPTNNPEPEKYSKEDLQAAAQATDEDLIEQDEE